MENERQNQPKKYSLDEYLHLEQVAESRYEYDNGSIVKMGYTSVPLFKVKDIYRRINFQDTAEQSSDS